MKKIKIFIAILVVGIILISGCIKPQLDVSDESKISECEKIKNQYQREVCYTRILTETNDPSICKKIENQSERNRCSKTVIQKIRDEIIPIREAAKFLWVHGHPSKTNVHITLPKGVREFSIHNHTIILQLWDGISVKEINVTIYHKVGLIAPEKFPISEGEYIVKLETTPEDSVKIEIEEE